MPTPLQIPSRHYGGILALQKLSEEELNEFIDALGSMPPTANPIEITRMISGRSSGMTEENVRTLVDTTLTLSLVRAQAEVDIDVFVRDLLGALREADDPKLKVSPADVDGFTRRFERLLQVQPLKAIAKGMALRTEYANTFCDARILTDVRCVFGDSSIEEPAVALINHSLKIEFHHGTRHKEIYISMDSDDLETLTEVIARAREKAASLARVLGKVNLSTLD